MGRAFAPFATEGFINSVSGVLSAFNSETDHLWEQYTSATLSFADATNGNATVTPMTLFPLQISARFFNTGNVSPATNDDTPSKGTIKTFLLYYRY
jgi:hypothetical protein